MPRAPGHGRHYLAHGAMLGSAGDGRVSAAILADSDLGIAGGDLRVTTGDLSRILGRPTTPMPDAVRAAVGTGSHA